MLLPFLVPAQAGDSNAALRYVLKADQAARNLHIVSYTFSGILLLTFMIAVVMFLMSRRQDYLYIGMYCLCNFLLIFFTSYLYAYMGYVKDFFFDYFDLFLLIMATVSYYLFTRCFLDTKKILPGLDRFLRWNVYIFSAMLMVFTIFYMINQQHPLLNLIENAIKSIILLASIVYVIVAVRQHNKLMNYLGLGTGIQIFFSLVSFAFIMRSPRPLALWNSSMFYYELGIIVSVYFFFVGVIYKNKTELIGQIKSEESQKREAEIKKFQTKYAVLQAEQDLRDRISADMHDDLGAGITTIRLYSEMARERLDVKDVPELEKISSSANELLNNMNAIIWSMTTEHDKLENVVAYIRSYAQEFLDETGIICTVILPEKIPTLQVAGEMRRNVFLVVKEALNNVVKHAEATEVIIRLTVVNNGLKLEIRDNGKGIQPGKARQLGNGLHNMKRRMQNLGIDFQLESDGNGTAISLYRRVFI
jgi:signal transduction histidine kinase